MRVTVLLRPKVGKPAATAVAAVARALFAPSAFAVLLALASCSRNQEKTSVAVRALRVGFIGIAGDAPASPEGWAHHTGELEKELAANGFSSVEFARFGNGPDLNEALSGGSLDIGIYGDTPALVGRAAGLPTRLVNQTWVGMDAWLLVPRGSSARSVADLEGKTVATSKGSYMHRYLAGLLVEKGLDTRVTFIHILPPEAAAALESGEIGAYAAPLQTGPLLVAKGARILDHALDHPGLPGSSVTVATNALLEEHPAFSRMWNALRERAIADVEQHVDDYFAFIAGQARIPLELARVSYPLSLLHPEPLTREGLSLLEGTQKFLVAQGLAQSDVAVREWALPEVVAAMQ